MGRGLLKAIHRIACFSLLVLSLACVSGGPGGGAEDVVGGTGVFSGGEGGNPATRPTPGFTELEVNPATSTSQPPMMKFFEGQGEAPSGKALALDLGGVEIDEIRMYVQNFNFDDNVSPGIEGPGASIIRLVENGVIVDEALPFLGSAILPEGTYHTLDFQYQILDANDIPADALNDPVVTQDLVGHSVVIKGSFTYNLTLLNITIPLTIPFTFTSSSTDTIRIEDAVGLALFGQDKHFLFIAHKVQLWFDITVTNLLQTLSATLLPIVGQVVNGVLILDPGSSISAIANVSIQIQDNINTAYRFAPSVDGFFDESDVLEDSFSFVLP